MDANEELKKVIGGYVMQIIQMTSLLQKQGERIKELEAAAVAAAKEASSGTLRDGVGRGRRASVKRGVGKPAAQ